MTYGEQGLGSLTYEFELTDAHKKENASTERHRQGILLFF